jgi:hypothetical protein
MAFLQIPGGRCRSRFPFSPEQQDLRAFAQRAIGLDKRYVGTGLGVGICFRNVGVEERKQNLKRTTSFDRQLILSYSLYVLTLSRVMGMRISIHSWFIGISKDRRNTG